jgi:hypothetical protein
MNSILDILSQVTRPNLRKYHIMAAKHGCHLHQTLEGWIATDMNRRIVAESVEIWDVISILNNVSLITK